MKKRINVPEEVVEEIFSWLPPESLLRFKCVCKSWYSLVNSLIDNSIFVAKHLHNAKTNILSPTALIFQLQNPTYSLESFSLLNVHGDAKFDTVEFNFLQETNVDKDFSVFDVYSCDGLVCVIDAVRILLCNPAIKDFKYLPEPVVFEPGDEIVMAGFGYDRASEDYKVVRVVNNETVQVYSLGSDAWREVKLGVDIGTDSLPEQMEIHHKGVCYWFFNEDHNNNDEMLSFDFGSEEFGLVKIPLQFGGGERDLKLAGWNSDSLALISVTGRTSSKLEMWMMVDGGGWVKYFTVKVPRGFGGLFTLLTSEEVVMKVDKKGREFVSYNYRTKIRTDVSFPQMRGATCWGVYVKTLIRVTRRV